VIRSVDSDGELQNDPFKKKDARDENEKENEEDKAIEVITIYCFIIHYI